ncbi:MAG TPA: PAS domain-containing protein [Chitinophagaceae bacterium]|nr:PAS domain-containing protein [Chitinophagaceae bacterium]
MPDIFFGNAEAGAELQEKINELIPSIVYVYNRETNHLWYLDGKITRTLGYSPGEISTWHHYLSILVYNEDSNFVAGELTKFYSLQHGESHSYKSRIKHKNGYLKYFKTTGSILNRNDKGEAETLLFLAEDITATVEAEKEITAKKQLIGETEELLEFGTWTWDEVNQTMEWSDGMYKILGISHGEAVQNIDFYLQFISPDDIAILTDKVKQSATGGAIFEHIYNLTTKAGQQKTVCTNGKAVLSANGGLLKIIGTTRDITEQINAYRDLYYYKQMTLEKEQFLQSGSWEIDLGSGKINWSNGMYNLFEYNTQNGDYLPLPSEEFYFSHFSDTEIARSRQDWEEALQNKDNYVRQEIITAKNGAKKWLETYGKVIRNSSGSPVKVMGATKDISRIKEYERQLEKRLIELERSNKDLDEFAYIASHDLQEPLRKISTFSERIRIKFEEALGDEGQGYIKRMLSAASNMRLLIDDLLNFSRLSSKAVEFEETSLDKLVEEVLTEAELQIEESKTTITKQPLPVAEVIPSQIKQLFANIISNAVKFRKQGVNPVIEISYTIVLPKEKEKHHLQPGTEYYAIKVQDNGIGFEQEYAEKIFLVFHRLNGKSEYPGTGIGLAICRKIAENHHGKIFAESKPGEGAVFTVILPEKNS